MSTWPYYPTLSPPLHTPLSTRATVTVSLFLKMLSYSAALATHDENDDERQQKNDRDGCRPDVDNFHQHTTVPPHVVAQPVTYTA